MVDYEIIHELGHILLVKLTGYPYFVRFRAGEPANICEYANAIIDGFIDHHAFKNDYYFLLLNYIDNRLVLINNFNLRLELRTILRVYIFFYLTLHFNLKNEDKETRKKEINSCLSRLEKSIIQQSVLTPESFQKINTKLEYFQEIKSTTNPQEIIQFSQEVLATLGFWDARTIETELDQIFPKYIKK